MPACGRRYDGASAPSSSPPAAPAGTCSRPRRWPASSTARGVPFALVTDRAAGNGRARCRAGRSTTSTRRARRLGLRRAPAWRCCSLGLGLFEALAGARPPRSGRRGRLRRLCLGADHARGPPAPHAGVVHEQNAVLGRANRAAGAARREVATSFAHTRFVERRPRAGWSAIPVRAAIARCAARSTARRRPAA